MTQQPPEQPLCNSTFERSGALRPAIIAVAVVWTVIQWFLVIMAWSAVQTYRSYQYSFTERSVVADSLTGYNFVGSLDAVVSIAAFSLTGIWLARARRNADRTALAVQRRDKMWVWVGWVFPVLSLWYPKRVVDEVWRGTVRNHSQPNTGWWWGTWVATQLLGGIAGL